jgi:hypothetical protein
MPDVRQDMITHVLLDENVDRRLTALFHSDFEIKTVPEQGWAGIGDKELLRRTEASFDVLVTMDQNLPYQQNLSLYDLAVIVLVAPSNAISDVARLIPKVNERIRVAKTGAAEIVSA